MNIPNYHYIINKSCINNIENLNGFYYIENIIDDNYSKILIDNIDNKEWKKLTNSDNSRLVQHYGYLYDYKNRNIYNKTDNIPDFMNDLINLLNLYCNNNDIYTEPFNQCIINNYNIGQGISKHIDSLSYGSVIACFTLNSGCYINFEYKDNKKSIYVKPNSLYILSGDARYKWTHEITGRKSDMIDGIKILRHRRISITFRNVPQ
jgi:alkylated DNA repair dioxygenase AlkB